MGGVVGRIAQRLLRPKQHQLCGGVSRRRDDFSDRVIHQDGQGETTLFGL